MLGTKNSRIDQVKFEEDSLQITLVTFLNALSKILFKNKETAFKFLGRS